MTPAEKLTALAQFHASTCEFFAAGVRMRHPEYTEDQVRREVRASILYGATLGPTPTTSNLWSGRKSPTASPGPWQQESTVTSERRMTSTWFSC